MPHIGLPNLIQRSLDMTSLPSYKSCQIQIIAIGNRIFSDRKPVIIIVFQDPLCLFDAASPQIDIRLEELIHLT